VGGVGDAASLRWVVGDVASLVSSQWARVDDVAGGGLDEGVWRACV